MKKTLYILAALSMAFQSCSKDAAPDTPTPPEHNTPGEASLVAPENNKACETVNAAGQVVFSWDPAEHANSYDLEIINLNTQGTTYHRDITETTKAVTLNKGIPYSWNITSRNQGEATTTGATWKFYLAGEGTVNYAPFPATALSPEQGSTVTPTNGKVTISWEGADADGDSLTYTLETDTTDGLQGVKAMEHISSTSFDLPVQSDTVYYWRVITSDGEHTSTSVVNTFRTAN